MKVYLLLALVAAAITYLTVPAVRHLALSTHAITPVRARDVHTRPVPRLGGVAMFLGLAVAMVVASQIPYLERVFTHSSQAWGILGAAALLTALGVADDLWDLDWVTKLAGQVLAAGFMAWNGVVLFSLPVFGLTIGSSTFSLAVTVLVVIVMINAVNFVDGLDGLAAGVLAIAGVAFFAYAYLLTRDTSPGDYASLATAVVAILVGVCVGFLPHNVHPASIFMGDCGSMVLGQTFAAAAILVTGNVDPGEVAGRQLVPAFVPILLPVAVLMLPLTDMVLAVTRRMRAGTSPFAPDRLHLHHRLLALGHSHVRAVLTMYLWAAVVAFSVAALVVFPPRTVAVGAAVAVAVAVAVTVNLLPGLRGHRDPAADPPDDADGAARAGSGTAGPRPAATRPETPVESA